MTEVQTRRRGRSGHRSGEPGERTRGHVGMTMSPLIGSDGSFQPMFRPEYSFVYTCITEVVCRDKVSLHPVWVYGDSRTWKGLESKRVFGRMEMFHTEIFSY